VYREDGKEVAEEILSTESWQKWLKGERFPWDAQRGNTFLNVIMPLASATVIPVRPKNRASFRLLNFRQGPGYAVANNPWACK